MSQRADHLCVQFDDVTTVVQTAVNSMVVVMLLLIHCGLLLLFVGILFLVFFCYAVFSFLLVMQSSWR